MWPRSQTKRKDYRTQVLDARSRQERCQKSTSTQMVSKVSQECDPMRYAIGSYRLATLSVNKQFNMFMFASYEGAVTCRNYVGECDTWKHATSPRTICAKQQATNRHRCFTLKLDLGLSMAWWTRNARGMAGWPHGDNGTQARLIQTESGTPAAR